MAEKPATFVSYNAQNGPCAVCSKPGLPCGHCRVDFYCGKGHQRSDFGRHKAGCGVLEVRSDPQLGRHLVATRDIPEGTVVMKELPLVCYPRPFLLPGQMLCVVCCRQLPGKRASWKQCGACGWPVCGAPCAKGDVHRDECQAFQRAGFKVSKGDLLQVNGDWMNALSTLRTCLASEKLPQLSALQADLNSDAAMKNCPEGAAAELMVQSFMRESVFDKTVQWLRNAGISWIPAEKLRRAVAANQLNGFCDDTTGGGIASDGVARGALYAGLCIMEHSCVPNTYMIKDDGEAGQMLVMVSRDVRKGEHLAVDYEDSPFRSLSERRRESAQRGFMCRCTICEDPTELGLYLSSPCCLRCSKPGQMAYIIDKCSGCGEKKSDSESKPLAVFQKLQEQSANPRRWEKFVGEFSWPKGPLHPTHHTVLRAKMEVVETLERCQIGTQDFDTTEAEAVRWESLCGDVLRALDVVRPGCNTWTQSVLLATYHVKGLQSFEAIARGARSQASDMMRTRESVKILERLKKMMICGRPKEVFDELKEDWKEIYALPKDLFNRLISG